VTRYSKPLALLLALLSFVGTSGSWHAGDDVDFQQRIVAHDHETHRYQFQATPDHARSDHCAVCHWLQSFRNSSVSHARVPFAWDTHNLRQQVTATIVGGTDRLQLPTRAPPA
jgi:hypothetical protein